jgi:hypothetical protein
MNSKTSPIGRRMVVLRATSRGPMLPAVALVPDPRMPAEEEPPLALAAARATPSGLDHRPASTARRLRRNDVRHDVRAVRYPTACFRRRRAVHRRDPSSTASAIAAGRKKSPPSQVRTTQSGTRTSASAIRATAGTRDQIQVTSAMARSQGMSRGQAAGPTKAKMASHPTPASVTGIRSDARISSNATPARWRWCNPPRSDEPILSPYIGLKSGFVRSAAARRRAGRARS